MKSMDGVSTLLQVFRTSQFVIYSNLEMFKVLTIAGMLYEMT